ncbi:unnamed protein product [Moneuplotes crassus]|uniref:Uncharacterized protein n=1 Tax=Euplotes crassus TaxID=5936 RepID=A0AAD2D8I4_EUPCR|nr:unnamed protein product [Moneuplotes crassus]
MQKTSKEKKLVIKKAHKIILKSKKRKNYQLGKFGPFKTSSKRSRSISKRIHKIKVMKKIPITIIPSGDGAQLLDKLSIIESIYCDVQECVKREGNDSESAMNIFDYYVAKLNELMKQMNSLTDQQRVSQLKDQLGNDSCKEFVGRLESCLSKIIARIAAKGYKEQSKVNFALLYSNIAQCYLLMGKYEICMENLNLALQHQRDILNDLERLLTIKSSKISQDTGQKNSILPNHSFMKNDNLDQYLGGTANQSTNELLTAAHYDDEYYTLVKIHWMQAHLFEIKRDYLGSINIINIIMKEIDVKYGKNNPIYDECSKKKGAAILKLSHSTNKQSGYSDLSTNSRSSMNNTSIKKRLVSPSGSSSRKKLRRYPTDTTYNSSRRKTKKMEDFDKLNKEATRLIERSICKNLNKHRTEITPQREIPVSKRLDLSNSKVRKLKLKKSVWASKLSNSNVQYSLQPQRGKNRTRSNKRSAKLTRGPSLRMSGTDKTSWIPNCYNSLSLQIPLDNNKNPKTDSVGGTDKSVVSFNDKAITLGHTPQVPSFHKYSNDSVGLLFSKSKKT